MKLILIRHADAENNTGRDFDRKLTEKGVMQSEELASFLKNLKIKPDRILTSPLVRAVQTAQVLQESLESEIFLEDKNLACGMTPADVCAILENECDGDECVIMVGHAPDMGVVAGYLTSMSMDCFEFKKCGCAIFNLDSPVNGGSVLQCLVSPKYLKALQV